MTGPAMNLDLIHEVFDVMERHGYPRTDSEHTGQAVLLISHLAHIYEGTLDATHSAPTSRCRPPRRRHPGRPDRPARTPSSSRQARSRPSWPRWTIAADYKRDRAATCADCAGQSCTTCQSAPADRRHLRPAWPGR